MELRIRKAEERDCLDVYNLSTDPVVRQNAINREQFDYEHHQKWFHSKLDSENSEFFIVTDEVGNFIGQVRFDPSVKGAFISISIAEKFRGKALGQRIIFLATARSRFELIFSQIRKENVISFRAFEKAGYELYSEDKDFFILIFSKNK